MAEPFSAIEIRRRRQVDCAHITFCTLTEVVRYVETEIDRPALSRQHDWFERLAARLDLEDVVITDCLSCSRIRSWPAIASIASSAYLLARNRFPSLMVHRIGYASPVISAVLFDLDETLLDRTSSLIVFLADQHGRFADQLGESAFEAWRDRLLALDARGHVHKLVVYAAILSEFGDDPSAADALLDDYRAHCCRHARGFPGMAATLTAVRAHGLRLGIVTNGETEFQTRHIMALGFGALVDAVLISETEGLRKPEAALFRRAADRLRVAPPECLFVGNNPAVDILGAQAAGLQAVWFGRGTVWPSDLAPRPAATIDALSQVLDLVGIAP